MQSCLGVPWVRMVGLGLVHLSRVVWASELLLPAVDKYCQIRQDWVLLLILCCVDGSVGWTIHSNENVKYVETLLVYLLGVSGCGWAESRQPKYSSQRWHYIKDMSCGFKRFKRYSYAIPINTSKIEKYQTTNRIYLFQYPKSNIKMLNIYH